jgi:hypothetical protein
LATAPQLNDDWICRTFDAAPVNAFCNHPEVLPTLSLGKGVIDVSAAMEDHRNVFMIGVHGGAMFHWSAPGVYDAHDFFLPEGRGTWALRISRAMIGTMFKTHGARMIWAQTPIENRACRMFNRWLGFKSDGVSMVRLMPDADPQEVETFVMERKPCL